jgi:NodT family efflux transporter outer membrane factor (OMF) lipoprotein
VTGGPADTARWWKAFGDPELDSLVGRAVQSNPDLAAAEARLRQARAIRALSAASFRPTLDADGSYAKEKISQNQPLFGSLPLPKNFPFEYSVYQAGFDASWEIDVFGGQRRALEAAAAEWGGAVEARNDVLVSLVAEVARTYVELRGAQRRLAIARENAGLEEQELALTRARRESGIATDLEVDRTAAVLAGLRAGIPPLESSVRQAMYGLAALLGGRPADLVAELTPPAPVPAAPPEVPVGLPSDLLRRRPDVRGAERELAAATARIGAAKSDWFPKFSLNGDAGMESVTLRKWFEPASLFWSLGPTLQWRALDFGRVRAEVAGQTAAQEAALAAYEKSVVAALQETESALVAYAQERNRRAALAAQQAADERAFALARDLQAGGEANFLAVLDADRALAQARDELAASDEAVSLDLVVLYKALGGGWETVGDHPLP